MRILMLAQFYPPFIGGEERFVHDLSVELAARGHSVAVVTLWHEGLEKFELDQGVRVYRVQGTMQRIARLHSDPRRRHSPPFPDPEVALALRRIIAQERPEIVHGYNWASYSFLPAKLGSGTKFALSLCDHSLSCSKKKLIYHDAPCSGPAFKKCLGCVVEHYGAVTGVGTMLTHWITNVAERSMVDMFLPVSQSVAEANGLVGSGLPYQVLPNFVADNIGTVHQGAEDYVKQLPQGDFLLFVGAFGRYKGVDVLLESYSKMVDAPPLVIIGYETSEYPVQTTNLPSNVIVLKNWPNYAVIEAWRRSTIGIIPSVWAEPFGIVVLEAMATGRPVVASRTGGITDIVVDEETGFLVTPGDAARLQQAIEQLLADPALREQMGQAGKQRVTEFKASTVVPRYEQVYRELIQSGTGSNKAEEAPEAQLSNSRV